MSDLLREIEAFEIDATVIRHGAEMLHNAVKVQREPVTLELINGLMKIEADLRAALDLASMARRMLDARAIDADAKQDVA